MIKKQEKHHRITAVAFPLIGYNLELNSPMKITVSLLATWAVIFVFA